jgi:hypothetical protein
VGAGFTIGNGEENGGWSSCRSTEQGKEEAMASYRGGDQGGAREGAASGASSTARCGRGRPAVMGLWCSARQGTWEADEWAP